MCMNIHIYVCICTYICVYTHMRTVKLEDREGERDVYVCMCIYICRYIYIYEYVHILCVYIYTH